VLKGCKTNVIINKIDFILIFAKIREKVCYSVDMCCNGDKHPFTANTKLKILIFDADESSIRPLDTIIDFYVFYVFYVFFLQNIFF